MSNVIDNLYKYRPLTTEELKVYTKATIVASDAEDPLSRYDYNIGDQVYATDSVFDNTLWIKKSLDSNKACSASHFEVGVIYGDLKY